MKLSIQSFGGVAPRVNPRYLKDGLAQIALNVDASGQSLRPLYWPTALATNLSITAPATIYRFGQDVVSDEQYWLAWPHHVSVARGQISGDTAEWTFFTDYSAANLTGFPKATNNTLRGATSTPGWIPLGIAHPDDPLTAVAGSLTLDTEPARVQLPAATLARMTTTYGLLVSVDPDGVQPTWTRVTLTGTSAATVAAALDALPALAARVVGDSVEVETVATGDAAVVRIRYGDYGYETLSGVGTSTAGTSGRAPSIDIAVDDMRPAISGARILFLAVSRSSSGIPDWVTVFHGVDVTAGTAATQIAAAINSWGVGDISAVGNNAAGVVTVTRATVGPPAFLGVSYASLSGAGDYFATGVGAEGTSVQAAVVTLDAATLGRVDRVLGLDVSLDGSAWTPVVLADTTAATVASAIDALAGVGAVASGGSVVVTTDATGDAARLYVRFAVEDAMTVRSAGTTRNAGVLETRQYVYTWVYLVDGLAMESAPSDPVEVEVYAGQSVILSGFPVSAEVGDYFDPSKAKVRIYRTAGQTFLFVAELDLDTDVVGDAWTDSVSGDALGEPLPSLLWTPPPATLQGIVNLPNGIMAGFTGRDLYFCEPYRPYAWPENYVLSMDAPIVGIGHTDTTVVVLTKGAPYLVQGTDPGLMTQVEASLNQACLSSRSIVSFGDAVYYAAPDGLVRMSAGGSGVVTAALFDQTAWRALQPSTIHAYGHDRQYIAFYGASATDPGRGGFIYHLDTGHMTLFDAGFWAKAGYVDRRTDALYLSDGANGVVKWDPYQAEGSARAEAQWRSKRFSFTQPVWFSVGKLDAESYGSPAPPSAVEYGDVAMQVYCDGVPVFRKSNGTPWPRWVNGRAPFRLPVVVGRDWEIEVFSVREVFNVMLAQSMEELKHG